MFEYFIYRNKSNNSFDAKDIRRPEIESSLHQKVKKRFGNISIEFLTKKPYDQFFYEDEHNCLFVLGSVFRKLDQNALIQKRLLPIDLLTVDETELSDLRGIFHIIRINKKNEDVTIFNDLFGLKPLYYGQCSGYNVVSNSLSAIKEFCPEIDKASFFEKLIFEHNLSNNTIFKNIFTLSEASKLSLSDSFRSEPYFSWYEYFASASTERKFDIEQYIAYFNAIVTSRADYDRSNLVTLTGGHDGRAVLSSFLKQKLPVETFSFGRPGSENTMIPEMAARKIGFKHTSVYLQEEFERKYFENSNLTAWLSDGELIFSQQSTLYAAGHLAEAFNNVFTGLLAGELVGAVHLLTDYINPLYYRCVYSDEAFDLEQELRSFCDVIKISKRNQIEEYINSHLEERKSKLARLKYGSNKHLFSLCDMITWGFRKFYGYQMHLARYHLENCPVFCDFDLMDLLINSSYNQIYKNSYKNLYHRRNSRRLQLEIITRNSPALSDVPLDRGYTPSEAMNNLYYLLKIIKYLIRKYRIKHGNHHPDFLGKRWTNLIRQPNLFRDRLLDDVIRYNTIENKYIRNKNENHELSNQDIRLISNLLFLNYKIQ